MPIDAMLSVVDGRWKGTILWRLSDGPLRTSELHRSIPGISERMLIRHLQDLVRDGILIRHQENTVPPCVRYSISKYGWTLAPVAGSDLCVGPYTPSTLESSSLSLRAAREEEELVPFCHPLGCSSNKHAQRVRRYGE